MFLIISVTVLISDRLDTFLSSKRRIKDVFFFFIAEKVKTVESIKSSLFNKDICQEFGGRKISQFTLSALRKSKD